MGKNSHEVRIFHYVDSSNSDVNILREDNDAIVGLIRQMRGENETVEYNIVDVIPIKPEIVSTGDINKDKAVNFLNIGKCSKVPETDDALNVLCIDQESDPFPVAGLTALHHMYICSSCDMIVKDKESGGKVGFNAVFIYSVESGWVPMFA